MIIILVGQAVVTALISVFTLFILSKLIGNKQISQMNMFDYINGITIGSIAGELAIADEVDDFIIIFCAMVVYAIVSIAMSYATVKSIKLRRIITGKPLFLFENNMFYRKNLKKAKLDINEILTLTRNQGYFSLSEISVIIIENNGKISILPKSLNRPLTPADMNITPDTESVFANVILDGKFMPNNLRHTGNNEKWLLKKIKEQGYNSYSEIMIGRVDHANNLTCYPFTDEKYDKNIFD